MKTRILSGMLLFSSLLLSCDNNEDEKFDPIKLKIESTDLTIVDDDEYMIPSTGGKFTIYSIDRRNIFCDLTYVEEGGIICHPENDGLFDNEGSYSEQWGKVIISSSVMPPKFHFTIYPNNTDKERKIRFGFNCFRYDCRIVSVIQSAGAVKQNDESGH